MGHDRRVPQPWMPDERAHAGPEHLDPAFVAGFDAKSGFDPSDDVQVLLERGLDHRSTVVDLGWPSNGSPACCGRTACSACAT